MNVDLNIGEVCELGIGDENGSFLHINTTVILYNPRHLYTGVRTNSSPAWGIVFGEFLISDVATCILYLILYGQNNSTVATLKFVNIEMVYFLSSSFFSGRC